MPKKIGNRFAIITFLLIFMLLFFYFQGYFEQKHNPNKNQVFNHKELVLWISDDGHYRVNGFINDAPVTFLIDTGATTIAVSESIAKKAGLHKKYQSKSSTANGLTDTWLTTIDDLKIAGANFTNEPAIILPNMDDEALLGMSFLKKTNAQFNNQQIIIQLNDDTNQ